jgi:hypothetical protein
MVGCAWLPLVELAFLGMKSMATGNGMGKKLWIMSSFGSRIIYILLYIFS